MQNSDKPKPVIIYIQGYDINEPSYEKLIELKAAFKNAGQDFLLIPEPDETIDPPYY